MGTLEAFQRQVHCCGSGGKTQFLTQKSKPAPPCKAMHSVNDVGGLQACSSVHQTVGLQVDRSLNRL